MKNLLRLSIAVLIFSANASLTAICAQESTAKIQEVARQFTQRLKETREFRPEGDELFVERFVDCHLREGLERRENGVFSQIGASIPPGVVSEASSHELQKYLIAQLNFFHLTTLYRISTRDLEGKFDDSLYTPEHDYPPGVYKLLTKNSLIAGAVNDRASINSRIQNVQQLRSVIPPLDEAISAMREYFKVHPPEETELYKKNMERIGNDKNNSKFWEVSLHKLTDQQIKEGSRCLGFSPRSFAIVKVPPFYQVFIFQSGKQFKIGSLLCTEPPCVD